MNMGRPISPEGVKRREQVLAAIESHWQEHGCGPTLRDLVAATGITAPGGVHVLVRELAQKGLVERMVSRSSAIWPKGLRQRIKNVALGGTAKKDKDILDACYEAMLPFTAKEYPIPENMPDTFPLGAGVTVADVRRIHSVWQDVAIAISAKAVSA